MNIVRAVKISSPISGEPVVPRISTRRYGQHIYTEAVWIDPASGAFIRKGVVKVEDAKSGEDVTSTIQHLY